MGETVKEGGIEALRGRIAAWRVSKGGKRRMPEALWEVATCLAQTYGVSRVSNELGLSYAKLKMRIESLRGEVQSGTGANGGGFVELINFAGCSPIRVEVNRVDGAVMRMELTDKSIVLPFLRAFLDQ